MERKYSQLFILQKILKEINEYWITNRLKILISKEEEEGVVVVVKVVTVRE